MVISPWWEWLRLMGNVAFISPAMADWCFLRNKLEITKVDVHNKLLALLNNPGYISVSMQIYSTPFINCDRFCLINRFQSTFETAPLDILNNFCFVDRCTWNLGFELYQGSLGALKTWVGIKMLISQTCSNGWQMLLIGVQTNMAFVAVLVILIQISLDLMSFLLRI